nr:MCE family protein [Pseudonocardia acaciae]
MIRLVCALVTAGAVAGTALAGCSVAATDLPLPGGAVEGETYRLTAVFADALNLPDGAHVKLNGDDIGRVRRIEAVDYTARVGMDVRTDVPLPKGTTAELRQATPLGEVFVALHPPAAPGPGRPLRDGDVIGLPDTAAAASVEDLLASLSSVVNGGGLVQLQTIVHELNDALDGRAATTGHLLGQGHDTLATLNARTQDIDRVLESTRRLTATLRARSDTVDAAFADLTPGIATLADQTDAFTRALGSAGRLADTGDRLIDAGGRDLRALIRDLGPVLDGFAQTKPYLGPSLRSVISFGKIVERITKGESGAMNAEVTLLPLISLPRPGDNLPGPDDLVDGGRSLSQHLEHQLRTLGGSGGGR